MRKRTRPQNKISHASSSRTGISWKYSALTMVCGATLVAGFFFAARQHFSSMDYGIKNSRLRKQLDELESEKRRLLLNKEISLSPSELMKAARKIGFDQYVQPAANVAKAEQVSTTQKNKPVGANPQIVQKTVINRPVSPSKSAAAEAEPQKPERQARKEAASGDKKYKS